ncbi:MAG: DUF1836 domain-containing protein [Lachnospiraceae bacterium]|nr:DUF1836 domain-containing protein [Lachnospiraceae bacterium]
MSYKKDLVKKKLLRWEHYIRNFSFPDWEDIPDIGLYMDQVTTYLSQRLDYLPPNLKKEESPITAATINNYVRNKVMPEPVKKRYYRIHLAYLLMICTLKQTLSIASLQALLPNGESEAEVKQHYTAFAKRHHIAVDYFGDQIELIAAPMLNSEVDSKLSAHSPEELIFSSVIIAGFSKIFAQKLLDLKDKDIDEAGALDFSPPLVKKNKKYKK